MVKKENEQAFQVVPTHVPLLPQNHRKKDTEEEEHE